MVAKRRSLKREKKVENKIQFEPKTINQNNFLKSIRKNDVTFGIGPAGTGKTFIGAMEAANQLESQFVERIILIRPALEAGGERLGFLPGDLDEKLGPYTFPIFDIWRQVWPSEKIQQLIKEGKIQTWPVAHLRGRTFKNSFVLVDEIQNSTQEQMYLILTRFGENSKMILDGDWRQSDLDKRQLSCRKFVEGFKNIPKVGYIEFTEEDILRHEFVKIVMDVYDKHADR
jgi:phosphate starvation-inducible PhoH-like protein